MKRPVLVVLVGLVSSLVPVTAMPARAEAPPSCPSIPVYLPEDAQACAQLFADYVVGSVNVEVGGVMWVAGQATTYQPGLPPAPPGVENTPGGWIPYAINLAQIAWIAYQNCRETMGIFASIWCALTAF